MAYAALVSLENTIHRFLNGNLFSISVEEKQQVTSLLQYVSPIRECLEEFPNESESWDGQMRKLADAAEDIIEYLVLEKVYLPCEDESESYPSGNHRLDLKKVVKETCSKLETVGEIVEKFPDDAKANSLKGRIREIEIELKDINKFYIWEETHRQFREKWRLLPAELAKLNSKIQVIHHLNKTRNDINSIMEEVMAMENDRSEIEATSSPTLATVDDIVGFPQDDADASECHRSAKHELQLEKVMEEIASVSAKVKNIRRADSSSLSSSYSLTVSSSSTAPPIHKNSLVGFEDHVMNIKDLLCGEQSKLQVIPVCGMGGVGKTTLARNVYDDQLIKEKFNIRVWITVSQDYSAQRILSDLLDSLKEYNNQSGKEESAHTKVYQMLIGRKYLVVMDDIWRSEAWDIVRNVFPDNGDGSRIMLTTRLYDVASYPGPSVTPYKKRYMTLFVGYDMWVPWCMKELRHVYFYGNVNFEYPTETTCSLENLHTISWLSIVCCRECILKKIPNLKKLKVYCIKDDADYDGDPGCLNNLVHLHRLEKLELFATLKFRLSYNLAFPEKLKRLTLRKLKLPWNGMIFVGSLPNLQVLKLKDSNWIGETWETTEGTFPVLEVLQVEFSGIENWITERDHFPKLKRLLLHHCRKLNAIPTDIGDIPTLQMIEIRGNVKESLLESAEVIRKEQDDMGNNTLQVVCIPVS